MTGRGTLEENMKAGPRKTEEAGSPLCSDAREVWIVLILFGLALAVRLYVAFHTYVITNDGVLFLKMSKLISQGEAAGAFNLYFLNLYPLMTAGFQKIFLDWEFSGQMVSTVFGSLAVLPLYFLVRSLLSRDIALVSSILFVFHPYTVRFSAEVIRGPAFWFFFLMALWVGWEAIAQERVWLFALTGLFAFMSFLLRPEGICVIPIVGVWVLVKEWGSLKSTFWRRIFYVLILLAIVPILLAPATLYLKHKSDRWHWGRAGEILRIATADIGMKYVKEDFQQLKLKPWDDSVQGKVAFLRLREFLSLATEHRIGTIALELFSKFQKAMHPVLLVLLAFGVIKRKKVQYHKKEELFLLSLLAVFFLILMRYGTYYPYIGTRHMMTTVILCLTWVGAGVIEVEHRVRIIRPITKLVGARIVNPRYFRWTLLALIVLALLPKTLASQRFDKIALKEAGLWIKENGPRNPVVMGQAQLARIGFYADGTFVEIPRNQDLDEYSRKRNVDFLAINERDIENTHPGLIESIDLARFRKETVIGRPLGPYVIRIYSVNK